MNTVQLGDCRAGMESLAPGSLDACVTDPPYELKFRGRLWDSTGVSFDPDTWRAVDRVLKPGAFVAAFGGTRTWHRVAVAIEDAGFEIRDSLAWIRGGGYPKSSASLKPLWEPIVLARKRLAGTCKANVARHGTGRLNIDDARVPLNGDTVPYTVAGPLDWTPNSAERGTKQIGFRNDVGRWPPNIAHDGSEEVLGAFPRTKSGRGDAEGLMYPKAESGGPSLGRMRPQESAALIGDEGSATRFFYCARPGRGEKEAGLEGFPRNEKGKLVDAHSTVKPVELMRWLVRLLCPVGGVVLDPFAGTGTTAIAASLEARGFIGYEQDQEYVRMANARISHWHHTRAMT